MKFVEDFIEIIIESIQLFQTRVKRSCLRLWSSLVPVLVALALVLLDALAVGSDVLWVGADVVSEVPGGGDETLGLGVNPEVEVSLGISMVRRPDWVAVLGVAQTLVVVAIDVLVVGACFRGVVGLEVPFALVFNVLVVIVEPETVVSVWISVVGDGVA
jgi:hypothetical protein